MMDQELRNHFNAAVAYVNDYTEPLPADLLLKLYAYYKIANNNHSEPRSKTPLINAFKANALIQVQNVSVKEAMQYYIALVNNEVKTLKR